MHSLQSIGVLVSNSWAAAHFPRGSFALNPESPLICWSSLTIDQFLCSITYIQEKKSAHCVNFFLFAKSPQKLTQLALITTCFRNWFGFFMKCDLECDFHDCDKMPKHVEMVRTKCQPKIWKDKMPTIQLAFCLVGILSAHQAGTQAKYSVVGNCCIQVLWLVFNGFATTVTAQESIQ